MITWQIDSMQCKVQEGDLSDVVIVAHWRCNGEQVEGDKTYSASIYSTCSLPAPEGSFTPFQDLTQDQVLGWIWANGVDKSATEAAVNAQIQSAAHPTVISPKLPWSA
jgi:hypothetical protein